MEVFTEYPGPGRDDYVNVQALNTAFLDAAHDFKGPQRGRLATAPFLLFSLREHDLDWWHDALGDNAQYDLMASSEPLTHDVCRVQSAGIGFLWQLAHRNPYTARIISGASVGWCEKLSGLPLVTVLERVGSRNDLLASRLGDAGPEGSGLLLGGASSRGKIRRSTHVLALQALLTRSRRDAVQHLPQPGHADTDTAVRRAPGKKV